MMKKNISALIHIIRTNLENINIFIITFPNFFHILDKSATLRTRFYDFFPKKNIVEHLRASTFPNKNQAEYILHHRITHYLSLRDPYTVLCNKNQFLLLMNNINSKHTPSNSSIRQKSPRPGTGSMVPPLSS